MLIKPLFPGAQQYPKHNWVSSAYQIIWLHRQSRVTRNKMIIKVCPPSFLIFTNLTCSNDHYSNNLKIFTAQIDPWLSEWLDLMSRYCQLSKNARMIYFSQSVALRRLQQPIRSITFVERTHEEIGNRDRIYLFRWHLLKSIDHQLDNKGSSEQCFALNYHPMSNAARPKWSRYHLEVSHSLLIPKLNMTENSQTKALVFVGGKKRS